MKPRITAIVILILVAGLAIVVEVSRSVHGDAVETPARSTTVREHKQLWTCGMHPEVIRDAPGLCPICHMALTPLDVDDHDGTAVTIDPVVVQNMGVRTAEAHHGRLVRRIRAAATLAEAEPNVRDVSLRVSGWIDVLHTDTVGMHIAAGAPLFELYSPEIQVAVEELIAARRAAAEVGSALAQAARQKLVLFGLGAAEIDRLARLERAPRTVTFTSPITGHLTQKLVVAGSAVKAGERILEIVDHGSLWLDAQVHAQDLAAVALGQPMSATIDGAPGRTITGVVAFIAPHLDPSTRTAIVRARVANDDLTLRPGTYATAAIDSTTDVDTLLVPSEAVIDTGRRRVAFVSLGAGKFEPREVTVGASGDDGEVEILTGLAAGERVVTSGQFLLDADSRMREAVQKHLAHRLLREQQ